MKIDVQRVVFSDESTISQVHVNDRFECYFLEDKDRELESGGVKVYGKTAIARGIYPVIITYSNRFKRDLPLLLNVKDFDGVRLHWGNDAEDTDGCPLCGEDYAEDWVSNSRSAFAKLFNKIEAALNSGEKVTLEIV